MKAQAGQTEKPRTKPGVNLLPGDAGAAGLIMALVLAKPLQSTVLLLTTGVNLLPGDAGAAGLIMAHVPVNNLHHKDVSMYHLPVVRAGGILIRLLALAVKVQPAVRVLPDLTG